MPLGAPIVSVNPRHLLAIAYLLALGVPLLPPLIDWLSPPPVIGRLESEVEPVGALFQALAVAGHAYRSFLIAVSCALLAVLNTVGAWWLWRHAPAESAAAPSAIRLWAPVPMALLGLIVAYVLNDLLA